MKRMPEYRIRLARELRHRETESERLLWDYLRDRRLDGLKFRRQRPIDRYIADFCCDSLKLVIEIDGKVHANLDAQEYDSIRDNILQANNYTLLRFSVTEVMEQTEAVLNSIRQTAQSLLSSPLSPARNERTRERGRG